ncbi:glycosyl transferase [Formicincola oecophyllae]|uniref:Glycosyl transferase n=1 Tax=Formicincola oecophyllae TaxID=2558361 RepID=A0A4Y6U8H6_9PROT|nr:glycosyl transferase [Formicincola oecophyllae]QDH13494.1 glycosyl transferase [Formicincola oecophyllae]
MKLTMQQSHSPQHLGVRWFLLLFLAAFLAGLPGRAVLPPLDRDEARYMEASEQMLLTEDFVDIHYLNTERHQQPAGLYWLEAASTRLSRALGGDDVVRQPWPYRLPSLLAGCFSIALTGWMGALFFGRFGGVLAAFTLMAAPLFALEWRMATPDSVLLMAILCAQAIVVGILARSGVLGESHPAGERAGGARPIQSATRWEACGFWFALGCGMMVKGPLVWLATLVPVLAWCASTRSFTLWRALRPSWGWVVMLTPCAPWCVAMLCQHHGGFFTNAIGHNLLGKITHSQESHGFPPGYYVLLFSLCFWPGAWFLVRGVPFLWRERRVGWVRYLLCWVVPYWLCFELLVTKLPHYALPLYPALALLTAGCALQGWQRLPITKHPVVTAVVHFLFKSYTVLWIGLGIAFCCLGGVALAYFEHVISVRETLAYAGAVPLLGLGVLFLTRHRATQALECVVGCALIMEAGFFMAVVPLLSNLNISGHVAAILAQHERTTSISAQGASARCQHIQLISATDHEPSLVFLTGPDTVLTTPTHAAYELAARPECRVALVGEKDMLAFLHALTTSTSEGTWKPHIMGHVRGLNYSKGRWLQLSLITLAPANQAGAPAAPPQP